MAKFGADTPMKRPAQPEEIAPAFVSSRPRRLELRHGLSPTLLAARRPPADAEAVFCQTIYNLHARGAPQMGKNKHRRPGKSRVGKFPAEQFSSREEAGGGKKETSRRGGPKVGKGELGGGGRKALH